MTPRAHLRAPNRSAPVRGNRRSRGRPIITGCGTLKSGCGVDRVDVAGLEYPALKRAVRDQQNLYGVTTVLIEDKASGTQLIQELIADGCHGVTRYQPTTDKIMRMHAQTAMIENGFVSIPQSAPWLAEYLHEMTVFPNGKHDDQVDSTAQFLEWFKTPFIGQNIYELYQRDAEAAEQRRQPQPAQTIWQPGSMQWLAEQNKLK
jgi:predicted phage terminase large subunit-like protein